MFRTGAIVEKSLCLARVERRQLLLPKPPTDSFNIGKTHKRRFRTNPCNNGQKFWSGRETFLK